MAGGTFHFVEIDDSFIRPITTNGPTRSPCGFTSRIQLRQPRTDFHLYESVKIYKHLKLITNVIDILWY